MITISNISIGTKILTKSGDLIKVETITSKRKHRKVGYHKPSEPCKMRYIRLCECECISYTPITKELLLRNNFKCTNGVLFVLPNENFVCEFSFYENRLLVINGKTRIEIENCETMEQIEGALKIAGIENKFRYV